MKTKTILQCALAFLLVGILYACVSTHVYKGDRYYDALAYSKAIPHYEKAYEKKANTKVGAKLAHSYFKVNHLNEAEEVYEKVVSSTSRPTIHNFMYARVLMANNKHDQAKSMLKDYLSVHQNDLVAKMLLSSCNSIDERYIDTSLYTLTRLNTNGFSSTFSVSEYQTGIVFSADKEVYGGRKQNPWTGASYLDLYKMERAEDGKWLSPELLKGDINGPFHEGPASFSSDGKTVYFTRSNYFKKKMEISEDRENNLKIFKARLSGDTWVSLEELAFNSDDYSVGHPALSPDGKKMYFISDMPGGYGGTDLYVTYMVDGKWSSPENLGKDINTPGNEMFPFYDEDGALYFSSDAHNSLGGLDVFITYHNGQKWAHPENLNYPINSQKDDFGFVINKDTRTGFVSSSRTNKDEIYEFKEHDPTFNLLGFAHWKGTEEPVKDVMVRVTNNMTGEVVEAVSDEEGKFKMKLAMESMYGLVCTKMGCFARTDEVSTVGLRYSQDFYADFEVEPIEIDKPIIIPNINYDFDKWNIRADAAIVLDSLAQVLKDNPSVDIEMGSHTDVRGSDRYNQVLSDKRAHSTVDYLISVGVDARRLTWKGYGETIQINKCKTGVECPDELHEKNRRTEFKVTRINKPPEASAE